MKPVILIALVIVFGLFFVFSREKEKEAIISPVPAASETAEKSPPEPHPDSIPAMSEREYAGGDLKLVSTLDKNEWYTRYSISYKSEGLSISGIMDIPHGQGPFPLLILNHGYIEPRYYRNGQGLKREQDFFAKNGYAVFHSDYRGYGFSDPDPDQDLRPRSGYVEDVLNAISAVKKSDLSMIDKENIGMIGHSMGGGITLNIMVTKPDIAKAYVLLAPINADYKKNFDRWVVSDFSDVAERFYREHGTYEENPEYWESVSAKNYFHKVSRPVLLHQGSLDDQVPVQWSRDLRDALTKEEKDITYYEYPNEGHTFIDAQALVMQRTLQFFNQHMK